MGVNQIIWISAYPPCPPFNGTTIKSCGILKGLLGKVPVRLVVSAARHSLDAERFRLLEYWSKPPGFEVTMVPRRWPGIRYLSPLFRKFFNESEIDLKGLQSAALSHLRENPDAIIVVDDFILARLLLRLPSEKLLFSPHDCMSRLFQAEMNSAHRITSRLKFAYRHSVVLRYERKLYHLAKSVHLLNDEDAQLLKAGNADIKPFVCPNAGHLQSPPKYEANHRDIDLLIWGNLNSNPIRAGVEVVLSNLEKACFTSKHQLVVLGADANNACAQFGSTSTFKRLDWVDDIQKFLRQVKVCLLPDLGGAGIKNRGVDAVSQGACLLGLQSQLGGLPTPLDYCRPIRTMEEAATVVLDVLRDSAYEHLGARSIHTFQSKLTPQAIGDAFMRHFEDHFGLRC